MILTKLPLNRLLQTREEVNQCTEDLSRNGLMPHALSCKNYDIRMIVPYLENGKRMLDMGCNGSYILHNADVLGLSGKRCGIDLSVTTDPTGGAEYFVGDLMKTPFENESFDLIFCLSVIEHFVDFELFAKEVSRLLVSGGKVIITTDYWNPKINTDDKRLYDLKWQILDKNDLMQFIEICKNNGLEITSDMDWTTQNQVIDKTFCAPFEDVAYTFAIMEFVKK